MYASHKKVREVPPYRDPPGLALPLRTLPPYRDPPPPNLNNNPGRTQNQFPTHPAGRFLKDDQSVNNPAKLKKNLSQVC